MKYQPPLRPLEDEVAEAAAHVGGAAEAEVAEEEEFAGEGEVSEGQLLRAQSRLAMQLQWSN